MDQKLHINNISISGFRAFVQEQTFKLERNGNPVSLALYAPNAFGKSSLIDAVEYFLSTDATLERLGRRKSGTQAGPDALVNVEADDQKIESKICISIRNKGEIKSDERLLSDTHSPIPEVASNLLAYSKVNFIIRGYQLRSFVESQSPGERYKEISDWFGLSSLSTIQSNLRKLRIELNHYIERDEATKERLRDLSRITNGILTSWVEQEVIDWINDNFIEVLDNKLLLESLYDQQTLSIIEERKKGEEDRIGVIVIKEAINTINKLFSEEVDSESKETELSGNLIDFENSLIDYENSKAIEEKEKENSKNSIFREIWESADRLFQEPNLQIDKCPVCETLIKDSPYKEIVGICDHIKTSLSDLKVYKTASDKLKQSKKKVKELKRTLISNLLNSIGLLDIAKVEGSTDIITEYKNILEVWDLTKSNPASEKLKDCFGNLKKELNKKKEDLEKESKEVTWVVISKKIEQISELGTSLNELSKINVELSKIYSNLKDLEGFIATELRNYQQGVLDTLKTRINQIFHSVHHESIDVPDIILDLSQDTRRAELNLLMDFSDNRPSVLPSGYLSDSQIHTLALSIRLSAIQMFNHDNHIIILDDVVTSFDADHRRAIAKMLSDQFDGYQIIIVTHDERFFMYLKEILSSSTWLFKRIIKIDKKFGPILHDHKVQDELIELRHSNGESAANEIRQAEEEWLLQKCREFGVDIRIREIHKPYSYDRSELAQALHNFLSQKKLEPPNVAGIQNRFIMTLQSGQVENFGSHFQDNPNGFGSIGDENIRWDEFKEFRDYFICKSCEHKKFKRPLYGVSKPLCIKCETPFSF